MKVYDISWPITADMTSYKDHSLINIRFIKNFDEDHERSSLITMSPHTGTHVDAPSHFLRDGKSTNFLEPLSCSGPALVIDLTHVQDAITLEHLKEVAIAPDMIVLFKTKNSALANNDTFDYKFVYIPQETAEWLANQNIKAVGIDYLGVEREQPGHETHQAFLSKEIPIIEGLRLKDVPAGTYHLWCLPLRIMDIEAAPARAILIEDKI